MSLLIRLPRLLAPLLRESSRYALPQELRRRGMNALMTGVLLLGGFGLAWMLVKSEFGMHRNGYCEYRTFRDPVTGRETRGPTIVCIGPEKVVMHR